MRASQRGLSAFGMFVVLALAVAAGYYTYKGISGGEDTPTCKGAFTTCMQKCRARRPRPPRPRPARRAVSETSRPVNDRAGERQQPAAIR